eukprot:2437719-Rhodomonas_salina.2
MEAEMKTAEATVAAARSLCPSYEMSGTDFAKREEVKSVFEGGGEGQGGGGHAQGSRRGARVPCSHSVASQATCRTNIAHSDGSRRGAVVPYWHSVAVQACAVLARTHVAYGQAVCGAECGTEIAYALALGTTEAYGQVACCAVQCA